MNKISMIRTTKQGMWVTKRIGYYFAHTCLHKEKDFT